jgi:hypothetical protein
MLFGTAIRRQHVGNMNPISSGVRVFGSLLGHALVVACALLMVRPACAEESQATIVAVEALLSLPRTQPPEGDWGHRAPPGFVFEEGNEEVALISWLKKQKKMGADLNSVRHGGTMLHHAIRAGMVDTVSWLLANGADPLKEGEHDALELALTYQQDEIFGLLIERPGVLDPHRSGLYLAWKRVLDSNLKEMLEKLIEARAPLPAGKSRQLLLGDSLRVGDVRLIRVLTEEDPDRALRGMVRSADEDIEVADRRLPSPIFLSLIDKASSVEEVDRLFRLRIRRPFDDQTFATDAVRAVLRKALFGQAPPSIASRVVERIPATALQTALKDENVLSMWWRWLSRLPTKDRTVAMERWGDLPLREPEALLKAITKGAYWFDQNEKNPDAAAAWGELLARLRPPLPEGVQDKLWMFVPQAHRLSLLQLGYRPSSEELRWWIDRNSTELVREFWPKILSIRPEIGQRSHELLFQPLAGGSGYCIDKWSIEKVLSLTTAATSPERPYAIEAACWYATPDKIRQTLLSRGWVKPPLPITAGRIVLEKQQCGFRPTAAWRRALAGLRSQTTEDHASMSIIDGVIAAAVPGEQDCVLFAWGGNPGGRVFLDDDSFEGTQRLSPCADGQYATAIWQLKGERIDSIWQEGLPYPGGMTLIRDTNDGKQYWLGGDVSLGGCGQTPPVLFRFESDDGQVSTLHALPNTNPAMQALLSQCQGKELLECLGYSSPEPDAGNQRAYPEQYSGLAAFADAYWDTERKTFIKAILDFEPQVLSAMKAAGIFPHWVTDALSAVSVSSLSLPEKRRRVAWLFRDRTLLRAALEYQMLIGLVDWLPPEDWGPIIQQGQEHLRSLQYSAEGKGRAKLACRFATALKQPCGEE